MDRTFDAKVIAMDIELYPRLRGTRLRAWKEFMERSGLHAEPDAERTALVYDGDALIASGSRQGNILKYIAVDAARQGEGLTATVLTALRQDAFDAGHRHLFLYTKPQNRSMFASLFFYPVAETGDVLLMENMPDGVSRFLDTLPALPTGGITGAAVMNCNPFTLGHRYLIETAAKQCDRLIVFVLSEDRSFFSAEDRIGLVRQGCADLTNVAVLPTGPYLISSATFPTYFLKDRESAGQVQCMLDIEIFANHYAPRFGITRRFVGTEPLSPMTYAYNEALRTHLPPRGIELIEIPRMEKSETPVSASAVRRLLGEGDAEAVRALVPDTTYRYLQAKGHVK